MAKRMVDLDRLQGLAGAIHPKDCPKVQVWFRRAQYRRYGTAEKAIAAATRALKPKAFNWEALLAFLKEIIPIIMPFIIKGRQAAKG